MITARVATMLALRGLTVFRLKRGTKNHFVDLDWHDGGASSVAADVLDKFSDGEFNIAVRADGHIIVDVDAHKGGLESLASFTTLPLTFAVRSPRGGLHYYFKAPSGVEFANSVEGIAKGIDIKTGAGGYVVGPGSWTYEIPGKAAEGDYTIDCDAPIAPAPQWLVDRLRLARVKTADAAQVVGELDTPAAIESARAWLLSPVAPIAIEKQGGNDTTYRVACTVMDRGVSPETCLELMLEHWNERCAPPWDEKELEPIVESAGKNRQAAIGRDNPAAGFEAVTMPAGACPFRALVWVYDDTAETAAKIPPRAWIVEGQLIRGNITVLGAPGATGKSSWALQMAIAVATNDGRLIAGHVREQTKVLVINNEDSIEEMRRRLAAVCLHFGPLYGTSFEALHGRIHLVSGHGNKFRFARRGNRGAIVPGDLMPELQKYMLEEDIGVFIGDPLVSLHESDENNNTEMQRVMDGAVTLAANTNAAGLLLTHTSKPSLASSDNYAGNPGSIRGATAVKDAARVALTAFGMSEKDGERYNIKPEFRHRYVRFDGAKENLTLGGSEPQWFKKESVKVGAGEGEWMGALAPVKLSTVVEADLDTMACVLLPELRKHELKLKAAADFLKRDMAFSDRDLKRLTDQLFEAFTTRQAVLVAGGSIVFAKTGKKAGTFQFVDSTQDVRH